MTDQPLPMPIRQDEIADIGDRTIRVVRHHMPAFDEYGTLAAATTPATIEIAVEHTPPPDPILRLEQKIDGVMRTIAALKTQIDSIDAVLARVINRL
ncbi:MAG TPA: hypothetical protein VGK04_03580 [Thermoanaerobaculia bacterium]|jgi:hypothetical protein